MKLVESPKGKVVLYFPCLQVPQWPMWAPLCQFTLATGLMHEGFEVILIDERVEPDPYAWLERELEGAVLVGIPGKSGDQCRNMEKAARFIKEKRPDVPVIVGGWFPSLFPDQTITSDHIDAVLIGPGDFLLPRVANLLFEGGSLEGVPNVYFKDGDRTVKNPIDEMPSCADTLPIPWDVVDIQRYVHPHGWINYFSSRGCPGGCRFCCDYCLYPNLWTGLTPERVLDDLEALTNRVGAQAVQILDANVCADNRRVEAISRGILERGLKLRFQCCGRYESLAHMTDEQRRLLRLAGCTEIEVGLETGSQRLADLTDKGVDVRSFGPVARRFTESGIRLRVNVMLGLPSESPAEFRQSLQKMLEIQRLGEGIRFQMFLFTPLPESGLGKEIWSMQVRGNPGHVPTTYRELLDFEVNNAKLDMFWLSPRHERDAKLVYHFYGPLLFYQEPLESARRPPWWRAALRAFRPLAAWRLRHGFLAFPFENWLNRLFGRPLPLGVDCGITPHTDVLPVPEMGSNPGTLPPLEPAASDPR